MVGKDVERISIRNYRTVGALELSNQGHGCGLCLPKPRSYAQRVDVIGACRLREHFCIRVYGQHGLRYGDLHYHAVVFWRACDYFPGTASQTGFRCQYCCASHAVAACHDERVAHASLVYEVWPWPDEFPDIGLVYDAVLAFCIVGIFLAQSYV